MSYLTDPVLLSLYSTTHEQDMTWHDDTVCVVLFRRLSDVRLLLLRHSSFLRRMTRFGCCRDVDVPRTLLYPLAYQVRVKFVVQVHDRNHHTCSTA